MFDERREIGAEHLSKLRPVVGGKASDFKEIKGLDEGISSLDEEVCRLEVEGT